MRLKLSVVNVQVECWHSLMQESNSICGSPPWFRNHSSTSLSLFLASRPQSPTTRNGQSIATSAASILRKQLEYEQSRLSHLHTRQPRKRPTFGPSDCTSHSLGHGTPFLNRNDRLHLATRTHARTLFHAQLVTIRVWIDSSISDNGKFNTITRQRPSPAISQLQSSKHCLVEELLSSASASRAAAKDPSSVHPSTKTPVSRPSSSRHFAPETLKGHFGHDQNSPSQPPC